MKYMTWKRNWLVGLVLVFALFSTGCAGVISKTRQGQVKVQLCHPSGETSLTAGKAFIHCDTPKEKKKPKKTKYSNADLDIWIFN